MDHDDNPYASPSADLTAPAFDGLADADSERVRQEYLGHEASVRSIGLLYYLGAILCALAAVGILAGTFIPTTMGRGKLVPGTFLLVGLLYALFAMLGLWLGRGVRQLARKVRIPVGILSVLGLLGFPLGTLLNGYILYLVFSEKGRFVFSDEYQEIIRQTPHIRYKTSILVWILLCVLLALLACGFVAVALGK